jgi:HAE1 family hydrophobic/amphiphilic exporter-1
LTPIQPLSISHQGGFRRSPSPAQGVALIRPAAIEQAKSQLNMPATINTTFQGNARAFRIRSTVPM